MRNKNLRKEKRRKAFERMLARHELERMYDKGLASPRLNRDSIRERVESSFSIGYYGHVGRNKPAP